MPDLQPWRDETRVTMHLAAPLVLTNISQSLITATDVVLLGWLGAGALAAGALGNNLYIAFLVFGMGLMITVSPMVAKEIGRRASSVRDVRRTVRQALWSCVALAVPVWIILWHSETILLWFGQDPAISADAAKFVRALQWGFLPAVGYLALRSFVAALERPIWALMVGLGGVIFNALINYGLIFGHFGLPALGLVGAGIGSSLTNLFMFVAMAIIVTRQRHFRRYHVFGNFWRADWPRFRQIWRLGLPIAFTVLFEVGLFNAAVFLMGLISADSLAAHAIAIQIASLSFMVPMGISQAATVRVGLALGRRDPQGIKRAGWTAFALGTGFMALMALILLLFPAPLVYLFLDESDPANGEVIRLAIAFLAIAALFQVVDGAQVVAAGMLRGLQDTRVPMIMAAFGYWIVGMGTAVLLGFYTPLAGVGIWLGLAAGLAIVAVLLIWRWHRRERLIEM